MAKHWPNVGSMSVDVWPTINHLWVTYTSRVYEPSTACIPLLRSFTIVHLLIRSIVRSFVGSFIRSFIHSITHSFNHSRLLVHSYIHSLYNNSFVFLAFVLSSTALLVDSRFSDSYFYMFILLQAACWTYPLWSVWPADRWREPAGQRYAQRFITGTLY